MKQYIAFDIGGTFIKYALIDDQTKIIEQEKTKTPSNLDQLLRVIEGVVQKYDSQAVDGIAVSAPGAVSNEGIIYGSSALPYIHGPNMRKRIAACTNLPVYIENDANCAAYAEVWNGSAKGKSDVLVIVLGTGIGGAVIKNGLLHKGANLHGGEFGYMLMDPTQPKKTNTWSGVASTAALVRRVVKIKQLKPDSINGEQIFQLAEEGDEDCINAVEEFYHMIAAGIYNLQYIYDPEVILIGGGISARDDLIEKINVELMKITDGVGIAKVFPNIDVCKYRQNANLLGAVYGYIREKREK